VIRLAGLGDLDAIMALETAAFPAGWSRAAWADELAHHVVTVTGEPVRAVLSVSQVADTMEVRRIIVDESVRCTGIGRGLLEAALADAAPGTTVFLEVSAENQPAIRLYEGCGFEPLSRRAGYYGPGDDAIVYHWTKEATCPNR